MSRRYDISIVGAGVTGLTVAALFARSQVADRLSIRVIDGGARPDVAPGSDIGLRVAALANGSTAILQRGRCLAVARSGARRAV